MKRSTKIITIITVFFLVIALVIIARTMIGNHFKKKFSKFPPPGVIVTEVIEQQFAEKLETYGTAISSKSKTFKIFFFTNSTFCNFHFNFIPMLLMVLN